MADDQREALWDARRCIRPDHLGCDTEDLCYVLGNCRARQNPPMPQSSKEKQEAFRARQAMLGQTEVRGIYAPPALHAAIKEAAKKMLLEQECDKHLPGFQWSKQEEKK